MKRLFVIVSFAAGPGLGTVGCEERIVQPAIVALKQPGTGGECTTGATSAAPAIPPSGCEGPCCPGPKATECYPAGNPSAHSGAECLAMRDNTAQPRWQLRQTLSRSIKPVGLASSGVANLLAHRSELKSEACRAAQGAGGFIQLTDFDTMTGISRTGFAKYEPDLTSALAGGLCFVQELSYQTDYAFTALYAPPSGWPDGLPAPMAMPWKVGPVSAVKLESDFTLPDDRKALLARFAQGGDLFGKAGGVFYQGKGTMHGYSPVTYIVNYDNSTSYVVVPIREAELTQRFNDPDHPNCAGSFLGDNSDLGTECIGDGTNLAWGCPKGNCAPDELAPTKIHGYFLLAEIEQVYTAPQTTLCSLFAAPDGYPGWMKDAKCRTDPHWNPLDSVHGLPKGDWCATTNDKADDGCHDALESLSYATFQAFPIRDGTCSAL